MLNGCYLLPGAEFYVAIDAAMMGAYIPASLKASDPVSRVSIA